MSPGIPKEFKILVLAVLLFAGPGALRAEYRTYRAAEAPGVLIPKVVDAMGKAGLRFQVKTVFNEKRDGRQGFVFYLQPSRNYCELSFLSAGSSTLVRLFTQNGSDSHRFHKLFTEGLGMTEELPRVEEGSPGEEWKVP